MPQSSTSENQESDFLVCFECLRVCLWSILGFRVCNWLSLLNNENHCITKAKIGPSFCINLVSEHGSRRGQVTHRGTVVQFCQFFGVWNVINLEDRLRLFFKTVFFTIFFIELVNFWRRNYWIWWSIEGDMHDSLQTAHHWSVLYMCGKLSSKTYQDSFLWPSFSITLSINILYSSNHIVCAFFLTFHRLLDWPISVLFWESTGGVHFFVSSVFSSFLFHFWVFFIFSFFHIDSFWV